MSKKLYLECFSGISGDMTVGALLDLGADKSILLNSIESLNLTGYEIKITDVIKNGIKACDFNVVLDDEYENNDHDMEYLHGNKQLNYKHHHEHRKLNDIKQIINNSSISENAKNISLKIFNILADAEAKAHGISKDNVSFHEVGAVDSIIDIVATAVCIDNLGITDVVVPVLYEGRGFVRCRHGMLPIPVPAVLNIINEHSVNIKITEYSGEFVTPTGAAIVAALCTSNKLPDSFRVIKTGIGAGKRNYEKPSLLRAMLIEAEKNNQIYKLETNIDDCSGEAMGYVLNKIIELGAKDIYFTPIFMKKNRPAYTLSVICEYSDIKPIENIIFKHTTTIGIRRYKLERTVLERNVINILTKYGNVKVKRCKGDFGIKFYPEYESVCEICDKLNLSYQTVYNEAVSQCSDME